MPCEAAHRIGWAVKECVAGHRVTRKGWKTPGQYLTYAGGARRAKAYLQWNTASGRTWPATLGHRDLLAEDWKLAS